MTRYYIVTEKRPIGEFEDKEEALRERDSLEAFFPENSYSVIAIDEETLSEIEGEEVTA